MITNKKLLILTSFLSLFMLTTLYAQEGVVVVNQDPDIAKLLELKKQVNKSGKSLNLLTIQIYSGNRTGAENAKEEFLKKYSNYGARTSYETPYYKVRVGRFKSRLEADRALERIKRSFNSAFIMNPKKDR